MDQLQKLSQSSPTVSMALRASGSIPSAQPVQANNAPAAITTPSAVPEYTDQDRNFVKYLKSKNIDSETIAKQLDKQRLKKYAPTVAIAKEGAINAIGEDRLAELNAQTPNIPDEQAMKNVEAAKPAIDRAKENVDIQKALNTEDMGFWEKLWTAPKRGYAQSKDLEQGRFDVIDSKVASGEMTEDQAKVARVGAERSMVTDVGLPVAETFETIGEKFIDLLGDVPLPVGMPTPDGIDFIATPKEIWANIKETTPEPAKEFLSNQMVKTAEWYYSLPPEKQQLIKETGALARIGLAWMAGGEAAPAAKTLATKVGAKAQSSISKLIPKAIDDVVESTLPEASFAVKLTTKEKLAGLRPDIKNRIAGKPEKLKEYFDVAKARNLDDIAPSPLSHAADKVVEVRTALQSQLDDVGSDIGAFRAKIGTVKADVSDIQDAIDVFDNAIKAKGLRIGKNNKLIPGKSRESLLSSSELKKAQEFRDKLLDLKGDPKASRIIDLRNVIDKDIKFGKSSKEISGELDPIAKATRAKLKEINEKIIGTEQSGIMSEYSEVMSLLNDLDKLTSKGANSEFLLKRVLSERDRLPKEVLEMITKRTGIDLMDDAQMSQIATELIGNAQQKGLFRQEISKAGLDAVSIVTGGKLGAAKTLFNKGVEKIADPEKVFMEAAKKGK